MKNKHIFLLVALFISCYLFANSTEVVLDSIPNKPSDLRVLDNNFKKKYTEDAYNYNEKEPSFFAKLKSWVLSKIRELFNISSESAITIFNTVKIIFYIIIITGVIYFLLKTILNKNGRWLFAKKDEALEHSNIEENLSNTNYESLIENSLKNENYRLAIRFYYLWLLKKMDQASIVEYDPQKTNIDYQQELTSTKLSNDFAIASYYYSYIWYGEFAINKNDYATASLVYNQLLKEIDNE